MHTHNFFERNLKEEGDGGVQVIGPRMALLTHMANCQYCFQCREESSRGKVMLSFIGGLKYTKNFKCAV